MVAGNNLAWILLCWNHRSWCKTTATTNKWLCFSLSESALVGGPGGPRGVEGSGREGLSQAEQQAGDREDDDGWQGDAGRLAVREAGQEAGVAVVADAASLAVLQTADRHWSTAATQRQALVDGDGGNPTTGGGQALVDDGGGDTPTGSGQVLVDGDGGDTPTGGGQALVDDGGGDTTTGGGQALVDDGGGDKTTGSGQALVDDGGGDPTTGGGQALVDDDCGDKTTGSGQALVDDDGGNTTTGGVHVTPDNIWHRYQTPEETSDY